MKSVGWQSPGTVLIGLALAAIGMQCTSANQAFPANGTSTLERRGTNLMTEENEITEPVGELADVKFTSNVEQGEKKLIVSYELANTGKDDIYLLDILPLYDLETRQPRVDLNHSVLIFNEPNGVRLIRGLPPYPQEKDMSAYITPHASKILPGKSLKRVIELPVPLVESNPYYSPLERDLYEPETVRKMKLSVHFIRSSVEGFEAKPVAFGEGVVFIKSKFLIRDVEKRYSEHQFKEVAFLKYPGVFTRSR
ncbi:MAG: hypothetical protein ABIU09_02975 [Pyrinomonadaceae bacterium]